MKRLQQLTAVLCLSGLTMTAQADEGMWMLTDLKKQNAVVMRELGLDLAIDKVYSPDNVSLKDAVVHFGGGCTGEVISANGLVLTNHHCGYKYIQQHSSVEHDYLTDGFWAMTQQEELPCKDLEITFIEQILDVTDYVKRQLATDPDPEGLNYLSPAYLKKVAERFAKAEKITTDEFTTLELKPYYGGNKYYLLVKVSYRDIRMVGAPPSSIGKFGADTDNWMWPRHTGDFSLFRIYGTKKGKPAAYHTSNVPLKVKKHLRINLNGIQEGDFTMVMGFPGRNWRYMISDEVEERMQTTNFMREKMRTARLNIFDEEMAKDAKTRIQYAYKHAYSANGWKNAIGMNEGLMKLKVIDRKKREQEAILRFFSEKGDTEAQKAFDEIREIVGRRFQHVYHQQAIFEGLMNGIEFSKTPSLVPLTKALESGNKAQVEREAQEVRRKASAFLNKDYDPAVDKRVAKRLLTLYAELIPADQRISIFETIDKQFGGSIENFVDACFTTSVFRNEEALNQFLAHPTLEQAQSDLMAAFAQSVKEGYENEGKAMQAETNAYNRAHKVWVEKTLAYKAHEGKAIYPDANSTLRLTYGKIGSYPGDDGIRYRHYTTLKGVMEKEDPANPEFVVPEKLKTLYANKDFGRYAMKNGEMPTCFVTSTDQTGGNSGSPVLNGKGELIGLGFDRNYEGLTGDIAYQPTLQRAICVDIRYVLFIIDKFAGAQRLIDELDIVK